MMSAAAECKLKTFWKLAVAERRVMELGSHISREKVITTGSIMLKQSG